MTFSLQDGKNHLITDSFTLLGSVYEDLEDFQRGLFQGGGTNVLCDVRTCCSTSMQLLVEEQMFLGSKQWDNSVWNLLLTWKRRHLCVLS